MAYSHFTLTLSGVAQQLSTVYADQTKDDRGLRMVSLQPDPANTGAVYLGGSNAEVTSSNYAVRLPVPVTSVPSAPHVLEHAWGSYKLSNFFVIGTANDKLHIGIAVN